MDIVERARADVLRSGTWADTGNLILEMADEIEKLRAEKVAAIAAEREECAKIADKRIWLKPEARTEYGRGTHQSAEEIAAAIRNRSQP